MSKMIVQSTDLVITDKTTLSEVFEAARIAGVPSDRVLSWAEEVERAQSD